MTARDFQPEIDKAMADPDRRARIEAKMDANRREVRTMLENWETIPNPSPTWTEQRARELMGVREENRALWERATKAEGERDALKEKLETKRLQMLERVQVLRDMYDEVYRDADATRARLAEAEAVIAWYADPQSHRAFHPTLQETTSRVMQDNGERARAYQQRHPASDIADIAAPG